jgi:hypothetical protein
MRLASPVFYLMRRKAQSRVTLSRPTVPPRTIHKAGAWFLPDSVWKENPLLQSLFSIMAREISLSGGDISVLKALGISGMNVSGKTLIDRLNDMEEAELVDALDGLMMFDYILCDLDTLKNIEDVERANFKVNPACAKELKDALNPQRKEREQAKSRRQRRG